MCLNFKILKLYKCLLYTYAQTIIGVKNKKRKEVIFLSSVSLFISWASFKNSLRPFINSLWNWFKK